MSPVSESFPWLGRGRVLASHWSARYGPQIYEAKYPSVAKVIWSRVPRGGGWSNDLQQLEVWAWLTHTTLYACIWSRAEDPEEVPEVVPVDVSWRCPEGLLEVVLIKSWGGVWCLINEWPLYRLLEDLCESISSGIGSLQQPMRQLTRGTKQR